MRERLYRPVRRIKVGHLIDLDIIQNMNIDYRNIIDTHSSRSIYVEVSNEVGKKSYPVVPLKDKLIYRFKQ